MFKNCKICKQKLKNHRSKDLGVCVECREKRRLKKLWTKLLKLKKG